MNKEQSPESQLKVLLATDGSDQAFRAATFTASIIPPGAEVRLVTVVSHEWDPITTWGYPLSDAADRESHVLIVEKHAFSQPRIMLEAAGASVTSTHRYGYPSEEILNEANEWGTDMIVAGRRGLRGPARWMLGSVSEALAKKSKVPILLVP